MCGFSLQLNMAHPKCKTTDLDHILYENTDELSLDSKGPETLCPPACLTEAQQYRLRGLVCTLSYHLLFNAVTWCRPARCCQ